MLIWSSAAEGLSVPGTNTPKLFQELPEASSTCVAKYIFLSV